MKRLGITLAVLALLGYGLFEARRLIEGPGLTITSPTDGAATSSTVVVIEGIAENIAFLTINGEQALTDEQGHFMQLLSPPPGVTVFTIAASDRLGRSVSKHVSITKLDFCSIEEYA